MRKALIKLGWKQKHLDKLETLGWSSSVKSNFANLQQLNSIVGHIQTVLFKDGLYRKAPILVRLEMSGWIIKVLFKVG